MSNYVMELVMFKTKCEVQEIEFMKLFHALNKVLERKVAGFVKRSISKDAAQDTWVEMIWWDSMKSAQAALSEIPKINEFNMYCEALQEDSITMLHLEEKS